MVINAQWWAIIQTKQLTTMKTLVNTRNFPVFFDGLFGKELDDIFTPTFAGHFNVPAVNIVDGDTGFRLEVAAPGLKKEDFKLNLENNLLTVSAKVENNTEETTEKYSRKEFNFSSFSRSFTLPNTIDVEQINATYNDGVLKVELPKKEEAKKLPRAIEVA
jgi:HSP20 family protein